MEEEEAKEGGGLTRLGGPRECGSAAAAAPIANKRYDRLTNSSICAVSTRGRHAWHGRKDYCTCAEDDTDKISARPGQVMLCGV